MFCFLNAIIGRPIGAFTLLALGLCLHPAARSNGEDAVIPGEDSARSAVSYPAAVVEKADSVLKNVGLRRSGKAIQSTQATELSRLLSTLSRNRRELRLQQKTLSDAQDEIASIEAELDNLNRRDGQLNLQLARIAGLDVASNNRLVALINATRTQVGELRKQRLAQSKTVQSLRSALNESEQQYAETVFQARKQIEQLRDEIDTSLKDAQVQIAMQVMHTNFDLPKEIAAEQILGTLDRRLRDLEKEIFQESIPLEVAANGALQIMVSVDQQAIRMVVDSGATLITLPADSAAALQITIPADAPAVQLMLANGDHISGRRITLPSVRVGQFEARDVEAVVLEPLTAKVQPLLGLSYLDRFRFEIDSAAKSLSLLRVADPEAKAP